MKNRNSDCFLVYSFVFFCSMFFVNSAEYNTAEGICSARKKKVRSLSTIGARWLTKLLAQSTHSRNKTFSPPRTVREFLVFISALEEIPHNPYCMPLCTLVAPSRHIFLLNYSTLLHLPPLQLHNVEDVGTESRSQIHERTISCEVLLQSVH